MIKQHEVVESANPYGEGHDAYHNGKRLSDNPYKRFTEDWEQWRSGWNDEKSDDPYWEPIKRIHNKFKRNKNG